MQRVAVAKRCFAEPGSPQSTIVSSCPGLARASTSCFAGRVKDVDGRDRPGHDQFVGTSRLCSAPPREERRAALRPGHGALDLEKSRTGSQLMLGCCGQQIDQNLRL